MIKAVIEEKKDGGPAALLHFLRTMDYDPSMARTNVKNRSLLDLKQVNLEPMQIWWQETLKSGQLLPDYLVWAQEPKEEEWPQVVSSQAMYAACMQKLKEQGVRYLPSSVSFSMALNKMMNVKLPRDKQRYFINPMSDEAPREVKLMGNKQYVIEAFPSLKYCRSAFSDFIGQEMTWPSEPEKKPLQIEF